MTNVNESLECLSRFRASLSDPNLATLDFDHLNAWLADLAPLLQQFNSIESDLHLIRHDYITRISGMARAIAAAHPTPDSLSQTVEFIDSLSSFNASQLLDTHRRISARFRDTFPTSYSRPFDR